MVQDVKTVVNLHNTLETKWMNMILIMTGNILRNPSWSSECSDLTSREKTYNKRWNDECREATNEKNNTRLKCRTRKTRMTRKKKRKKKNQGINKKLNSVN
jgi:hypothetical protein